MTIQLELTKMQAARLQGICKQITNTHRRYPHSPEGRSTIYGLSQSDCRLITALSSSITDALIDSEITIKEPCPMG